MGIREQRTRAALGKARRALVRGNESDAVKALMEALESLAEEVRSMRSGSEGL